MKKKALLIFVTMLFFALASCSESAEQMVKRAYSTKDNQKTLQILDETISRYPDYAQAYFLRARMKLLLLRSDSYLYPRQFSYYDYEPIIRDYSAAKVNSFNK